MSQFHQNVQISNFQNFEIYSKHFFYAPYFYAPFIYAPHSSYYNKQGAEKKLRGVKKIRGCVPKSYALTQQNFLHNLEFFLRPLFFTPLLLLCSQGRKRNVYCIDKFFPKKRKYSCRPVVIRWCTWYNAPPIIPVIIGRLCSAPPKSLM